MRHVASLGVSVGVIGLDMLKIKRNFELRNSERLHLRNARRACGLSAGVRFLHRVSNLKLASLKPETCKFGLLLLFGFVKIATSTLAPFVTFPETKGVLFSLEKNTDNKNSYFHRFRSFISFGHGHS